MRRRHENGSDAAGWCDWSSRRTPHRRFFRRERGAGGQGVEGGTKHGGDLRDVDLRLLQWACAVRCLPSSLAAWTAWMPYR